MKLPTFAQRIPEQMNQTINIYPQDSNAIQQLNNKLDRIMASIEQINAQLVVLQSALDNEQSQIAAAIAGLQQTITDLNAQIANGATPEQLQAVADKLTAIQTDLEGTIPDAAPATDVPA